ncbi:MAG TPA: hypothetical protein VN823_05655 [Stellaceae bacterium]|nr:hypothetical protein [Stellaceae bacterium]
MQQEKLDCVAEVRDRLVDIGDLDFKRNLKIRAFLELVLAPVFRDLQPRLKYVEMGRRGITPMQYFQDFRNYPAAHGYGDHFEGRYEVRLCRSVSHERRAPGGDEQRVERLILETRTTLTGRPATGAPASLGFEPPVGTPAVAGTGRVLHVLTRPQNPPGHRWVSEVPEEIAFLKLHPFDDPFPTIPRLAELEDGFTQIGTTARFAGVWGIANSDVFQHVHAREYTVAMENGIALSMADAKLPLDTYLATRARVIFRRPSFVGQRYALRLRLFRRDAEIVALGAFHGADDGGSSDDIRASVYLRFDGRLA